jgi:hypothetical protein
MIYRSGSIKQFFRGDPNLIAYYNLYSTADFSNSANKPLTNNNVVLSGNGGNFNPSLSAYLRYASAIVTSFPFTWIIWVKSPYKLNSELGTTVTVLSQGGNPGAGGISPWLWFNSGLNGRLDFGIYGSTDRVLSITSSTTDYPPNKWLCIVAVARGVGDGDLFENGVRKTVNNSYSNQTPQWNSNFYIGANVAYNDYKFNGWIREVAVFSRALSSAEISAYYKWAIGARNKSIFLLGKFPFDERNRLVEIQSSIFSKDNQINREQNRLVSIQSSVFGRESFILNERGKIISIQSSVFETSKRERPKQLIKSLKTESPQTKIENLP